MSTRDIQGHARELYGIEISPDLVSTVTDAVHEKVTAQLKPINRADTAEIACERLEEFDRSPWGEKYPAIAQSWRHNWEHVIPFFAFAPDIPRIIYTTHCAHFVCTTVSGVFACAPEHRLDLE